MKFMRNEEGFTGLEAAIVLIAFVVVAAVFSYVMLGAGFFTSQKSQEVVHTSVDTASASLEVRGDVIGRDNTTNQKIDVIEFAVAQTAGGTPVDLNSTVLTYATDEGVWILDQVYKTDDLAPGKWMLKESLNGDGDTLVEKGELAIIQADIGGDGTATFPAELEANENFNLEIQPADGAALGLKRTAPPQIDKVNLLY
ncbi:flagellin FlaB [Methanofollis sp. W23]|uniref:archaellin/type IV pilin N-terminal domain-containing protein n=1 Tax=Methanofollis sp. W23 TaxID=2817849 RepID=UPI001AEA4C9F|nr:archaellin/type IV pilin N-terminal domain-containing protein [Methanofollis sp. W23]MBP2145176.1 flagellin FlaB [Methanofollis sp. W23]